MTVESIFVKDGTSRPKEYFYYDTYNEKKDAINDAKRFKKKNKSKYVITEKEEGGIIGFLYPHKRYKLYLNKIIRLW